MYGNLLTLITLRSCFFVDLLWLWFAPLFQDPCSLHPCVVERSMARWPGQGQALSPSLLSLRIAKLQSQLRVYTPCLNCHDPSNLSSEQDRNNTFSSSTYISVFISIWFFNKPKNQNERTNFSCRICEYSWVVWRRNGLIVPPSSRLKQVTTHDVTILPRLCRKPEIIPVTSDRNLRAERKKPSVHLHLLSLVFWLQRMDHLSII